MTSSRFVALHAATSTLTHCLSNKPPDRVNDQNGPTLNFAA